MRVEGHDRFSVVFVLPEKTANLMSYATVRAGAVFDCYACT